MIIFTHGALKINTLDAELGAYLRCVYLAWLHIGVLIHKYILLQFMDKLESLITRLEKCITQLETPIPNTNKPNPKSADPELTELLSQYTIKSQ